MNRPPPPSRLYWICQFAGWGGFLAYVLVAYMANASPWHAWDFVSIVFFDGVACPALTHGLRHWMYVHEWPQMPMRRLLPRLTGVVVLFSAVLSAAVALGVMLASHRPFPLPGFLGVFFGFCWGFAGWIVIYYEVHARRRRDALQAQSRRALLELTVVTRDAQLRSLRAQLNPHFLFNCLNSLRHLILANPERAAAMVTGLAELLRYSLASDRTDAVPLAEELDVVDEYLALEQVRLEERLRVERAVEPAALAARVPPMLVQTLVDNAIKHGIAEEPRGGVVRIEARVNGARLELVVINTGRLKPPAPGAGHGVRNSTERLRLLYGDAASLRLTEADGMVRASLVLPMGGAAPVPAVPVLSTPEPARR